jgi:hypothetical protein
VTRADRFVAIYSWVGIASGIAFLLIGAWTFWVSHMSLLLFFGVLTLVPTLIGLRQHRRRRQIASDHVHRPVAEALDGGGVDAGGGDEDAEGLA